MAAAQARPGYESNMLEGGYSRSFGADGVPQVNVDPVSSATTCIVEVKHEGVGMRAAIRSSVEVLAGRLAMELLQDAAPQPADSDQGPFRQSLWSMVRDAARISILVREYDKATWGDDLIETNLYLLTSAAE